MHRKHPFVDIKMEPIFLLQSSADWQPIRDLLGYRDIPAMGVGVFHLHVTDPGACLFIALHRIFNHMTVIFMSNYHDQPARTGTTS
jgi:hypothetical protein